MAGYARAAGFEPDSVSHPGRDPAPMDLIVMSVHGEKRFPSEHRWRIIQRARPVLTLHPG